MMDVPRGKEVARKRLIRRIVWITLTLIAVGGATVALARLKPAAPSVDASGLWPGTVRRGPMEMQVRGLGALKPEEIHWIAAAQDSRVAQIVRRAGIDEIKANDVILVLSNPDLELEAEKAEWQMKQDEANLANLKVNLESDKLDQRAQLAELESQETQAKLTADRDLELTRLNLQSDLTSRLSVANANQLHNRVELQKQRLVIQDQAIKAQIEAQQVVVESSRAAYELKRQPGGPTHDSSGNRWRAAGGGCGGRAACAAGTMLAKVADPTKLKAVLQIAGNADEGRAHRPGCYH